MIRFYAVGITALAVVFGLAVPRFAAVGLIAGVVVGVAFFFIAISNGQGLVNARLVKDPDRPNDPNAAISMGLGAAGIACGAVANPHYPQSFRYFYLCCAVVGALVALVAAWRNRAEKPSLDSEESADRPS
jgi:protein-S-isoprenylcysteine O-methyltransferase Ste14